MPTKKPKTARAVHPNAGVRAWYQRELQELIKGMAQALLAALREAERGPSEVVGDAKKPSIDLLDRALRKWGGMWVKRFNQLGDKLANEFANKSRTVTDAMVK